MNSTNINPTTKEVFQCNAVLSTGYEAEVYYYYWGLRGIPHCTMNTIPMGP
jgi:peroxiredoxin family protein